MSREGGQRPRRLDAPVLRADELDRGATWTDSDDPVALDVALSRLMSNDRDVRRTHRRGGHRGARARPAHARLHLQHAAARTRRSTTACASTRRGWPAATSPTRPATSPSQALIDAVARPTTTCRGAGTASRRGLLGLDRLADYDRMASVATEDVETSAGTRRPTSCSSPSTTSPPVLAGTARALLRRALDRRARAPGQARRRVLRLHRPERPPLRDAQLHLAPPRRAHARPRARPRPARRRWPSRAACFEQHTPLTLAETASVFGETLVFRAAARRRRDAGLAPGAAGREHRGLDRHGLPPDRR